MPKKTSEILDALSEIRASFGDGCGPAKLELLRHVEQAPLTSAQEVLALHEILCFLRAYPDDPRVLSCVERMLEHFDRRADLLRHRRSLRDTGIAGTAIHYRFFWPMARWLARRWPQHLHLDWKAGVPLDRLAAILPLLVSYAEVPALKKSTARVRELLPRLAGPLTTDASFLVQRIGAVPGDDFTREALHDAIDAPYRLDPGSRTPSRTRARHRTGPVCFQTSPLQRERPDLRVELGRPPRAVRTVSRREGRALIDLACEAMVTRSRDLEVFVYGDARDVRIVLDHDGLAFACIGFVPERRLLFRAAYGLLTLKNGVPIGYVQADALFESAEIAFNTFDTYRGGEAALVFARLLATARHLFGARAFSIEPYQLGDHNEEGLESGAWWFYYKLGFRPEHPRALSRVEAELAELRADPRHRSSRAVLAKLAAHHLYFEQDPRRQPVEADLARIGWPAGRALAERGRVGPAVVREAARRLGLDSWGARSAAERLAIARWSSIILALPGLERWSTSERRAVAAVVRAKGGPRETDFVRLFDAHPKLGPAIAKLARSS